ncbi:MAG: hypothetical protein LC791_09515 [Acidobacteria bacterium]|nr:hypothetical protein [Acidobacteriota bacterium]
MAATRLPFPIRTSSHERAAVRRQIALPARLTWKDASGAVRFASVVTRDVSDVGAFVECDAAAPIPLYRLVHVQLERPGGTDEALPARLRDGRVLSAVWRVGPCKASTGTPSGYALRFLIDPHDASLRPTARRMAVAS